MIFATNYLPEFEEEADDSIYRRFHIIKFDKKFTEEEINEFDKSKILTNEAIDYLANISLREYLKIKDTRKLANHKESSLLLAECKNANNSVQEFLEDPDIKEELFANSNQVPNTIMYSKYVHYCNAHKYFVKKKSIFYDEVFLNKIFVPAKKDGYDYVRNTAIKSDGLREKIEKF